MPAQRGPGPQPGARPRGRSRRSSPITWASRHVVWLGQGIEGDDTHGHVDDVARFVDARRSSPWSSPHESDPNYEPLQDNRRRLEQARDQDGEPLRVVALPMPEPVVFDGQRSRPATPTSTSPTASCSSPRSTTPTTARRWTPWPPLFPDREVVGIYCVDLVLGLGTLHCLSQQQPSGAAHGPAV